MLESGVTTEQARAIYDRIGQRYDLLRFAEVKPKSWALRQLRAQAGERTLDIGCGPGWALVALARTVVPASAETEPGPWVCGLDVSPVMLESARRRLRNAGYAHGVELREGVATRLPYPDAMFDAVFSSYMLDLLTIEDIELALAEMWRVLRPDGRLALVGLSRGRGKVARLYTRGYEALYRRHPRWLAGCRPMNLTPLLEQARFTVVDRAEWFRGHPSEAILARPR